MASIARPLVLAVVAIVVSFLVTLWLSQSRLNGIESEIYDVATVAQPSVVHLDVARAELERMGLYADEYVSSVAAHVPVARASRAQAQAAREHLGRALASYEDLPFFPGEEEMYRDFQQRLRPVDQAMATVLERTEAGDFDAALLLLARDLHPEIDRASSLLKAIVDYDAAHALDRLSAIRSSRRSAQTMAVVAGSLSLLFSLGATLLATRAAAHAAARRQQVEQERAARTYLEKALRGRDQFLALASHELRTPLTALQLALSALARRPERPAQELLATAQRRLGQMSDLVEELMQLARIDLGALALERAPGVDLVDLARSRIAALAPEIERSGSAVSLRADGAVAGRWDRAALGRVMDRLLSNAMKFGQGKPIEVEVSRDGGAAQLVVRDHGPGIPADRLGAVFDRFERGVSERHYPGLGLGLYVARCLVEAHGGTIRAASGAAGGTTITVVLPLDATAETAGVRPALQS